MFTTLEPLGIVVNGLSTVQKFFEGDVIVKSRISPASIAVDHLCVQVAVLRCASNGSAGSPNDVPCQGPPQARHLNAAMRIAGYRRMTDYRSHFVVEPVDETSDVGVDRARCSCTGGAEGEPVLGAHGECREEEVADRDLFQNGDGVGGFVSDDPRDRGR